MDNNKVFRLHLQSTSDIITNSSSETFIIRDADCYPKEILQKELETFNKSLPRWHEVYEKYQDYLNLSKEEKRKFENCSGDGGTLKVTDWKDEMREWIEYAVPENKKSRITPEIWSLFEDLELDELKKCLWVRIDEGYRNTINYFLENYEVYEKDCRFIDAEKDPQTGRLLNYPEYEDYQKLPKERQANYWEDENTNQS